MSRRFLVIRSRLRSRRVVAARAYVCQPGNYGDEQPQTRHHPPHSRIRPQRWRKQRPQPTGKDTTDSETNTKDSEIGSVAR